LAQIIAVAAEAANEEMAGSLDSSVDIEALKLASRGAIYRVESPIRRVHMAEFSRAWAAMYGHARTIKLAIKKITAMGQR
jgi:hypothetical protein